MILELLQGNWTSSSRTCSSTRAIIFYLHRSQYAGDQLRTKGEVKSTIDPDHVDYCSPLPPYFYWTMARANIFEHVRGCQQPSAEYYPCLYPYKVTALVHRRGLGLERWWRISPRSGIDIQYNFEDWICDQGRRDQRWVRTKPSLDTAT